MDFEEFSEKLRDRNYGIVAMNHCSIDGEDMTYCAVKHRLGNLAFVAEGAIVTRVFRRIIEQIDNFPKGSLETAYALETTINRIINGIESDLNNRKGFHVNDLEDDIQDEIRLAWRKAIIRAVGPI